MIKFVCTNCGQHLEAESEMSGTNIDCPSCGHDLTIPSGSPRPAIRIPSDRSSKTGVRLSSKQLKILWTGIAFVCFFGFTQMHCDGPIKIYHGCFISKYSQDQKSIVAFPNVEFTPIYEELLQNTIALLLYLAIATTLVMLVHSRHFATRCNPIQQRIICGAMILLALVFAFPVYDERGDYSDYTVNFFISPIVSDGYRISHYAAYLSIVTITVLLVTIAAIVSLRKPPLTEPTHDK